MTQIKAVLVNELEFIPESTHTNIKEAPFKAPYKRDFTAQAAVRVGNLVHTISVKEQSKYISGFNTPDGNYHSGFDISYIDLSKDSKGLFHTLTEAGIEIDFSEVYLQYQNSLAEAKKHKELLERANRISKYRRRRENFTKEWFTLFEGTIKNDRNKKIRAAVELTTFSHTPIDQFILKGHGNPNITYRGITVYFGRDNGSLSFDCGYEYPEGVEREDSYSHRVDITDPYGNNNSYNRKVRKAKREGTIYLKAIEGIDEYLAIRESRLSRSNKEKQEREEIRAILEKTSGNPVHIFSKTNYYNDGRRNGNMYKTYNYQIVTENQDSKYGSPKGISINTKIPTKYKDGEYIPMERTYSVGGFSGLRKDQFIGMVEILLDGKKGISRSELKTDKDF